MDSNVKIRQGPRATYRSLSDGRAVLLHLDTAAYHSMNATGTAIWESIGEEASVRDLVQGLRERFPESPEDVETDVHAFLEGLHERDLIVVTYAA